MRERDRASSSHEASRRVAEFAEARGTHAALAMSGSAALFSATRRCCAAGDEGFTAESKTLRARPASEEMVIVEAAYLVRAVGRAAGAPSRQARCWSRAWNLL